MNGREGTRSQVSFWEVVKRFLIIFLPLWALMGSVAMEINCTCPHFSSLYLAIAEMD